MQSFRSLMPVVFFVVFTTFLRIEAQPPNIIFILTDDLGYGDLGVLWQKDRSGITISTPELDQMAGEGLILDQHYAPAPVCAPSRSSLISGLHQGHATIRDNQFDKAIEDNHNIANTLQAAGYYTALVGKYGLQGGGSSPSQWAAYPTKRGFDYFYGYVRHADGHQHYPANTWSLGDNAGHREAKELWENDTEVSSGLDKCYTGDLFTAKAKQIIESRTSSNPNEPFFIFLSYDTPHGALQLPTVAYPSGNGLTGGLRWLGTSGNMINTATGTIDSYRDPSYTGQGLGDTYERHGTVVSRISRSVGDLLQTLRDLNIEDNTIVIFTSDNGPSNEAYITGGSFNPQYFQSYGPFEGMKRDVFEGGIRMPTLVWGPGNVVENKVSDRPSQFHDWLATFVDFAGVERPARVDGVSLKAEITGQGVPESSLVYVEYNVGGSLPNWNDFSNNSGTSRAQTQVILLEGYKGIRNNTTSHSLDFKIFDVVNDPREGSNLAGTSAYFTGLQQRMKDKVLQVRMPNSSAPRAYDDEPVPAVTAIAPVNGVLVRAYEGDWSWVPNFERLQDVNVFLDSNVTLSHLSRPNQAGLFFTGYLSVPTAGNWNFYAQADEGVVFKLHEKLVLDGDYNYDGSEMSQAVNLAAGLHPFRLYYRTATKTPSLQLLWSGPGVSKEALPAAHLYREEAWTSVEGRTPSPKISGALSGNNRRTIDGKRRSQIEKKIGWPLF